jgi:hypothetical protein
LPNFRAFKVRLPENLSFSWQRQDQNFNVVKFYALNKQIFAQRHQALSDLVQHDFLTKLSTKMSKICTPILVSKDGQVFEILVKN